MRTSLALNFLNIQNQELKNILKFEENFNVDEWKILGLRIWPYIRISLSTAWVNKLNTINAEKTFLYKKSKYQSRLASIVRKVNSLKFYFSFLIRFASAFNNSSYPVISSSTKLTTGIFGFDVDRVHTDKGYYNRYSDSLIETGIIEEDKCIHFERCLLGSRTPFRPFVDITHYYWLSALLGWVLVPIFVLTVRLNPEISNAYAWCVSNSLDGSALKTRNIIFTYLTLRVQRELYKHLISKYRLNKVIKVGWYDVDGMALAWACNRAGIPFVDIQHGMAGANNHRAYSCWSKIPLAGYELLPSDYWCWSKVDADSIIDWYIYLNTYKSDKVRIIGIPFANYALTTSFNELFSCDEEINFLLSLTQKYRHTVIVSLAEEIPQIIIEAIKGSHLDIFWLIRYHPTLISKLDKIKSEIASLNNTEIYHSSTLPLYALLKICSCNITEWSATFFDASAMKVPTIFVSGMALTSFPEFLSSGEALFADSPVSLLSAIRNLPQ